MQVNPGILTLCQPTPLLSTCSASWLCEKRLLSLGITLYSKRTPKPNLELWIVNYSSPPFQDRRRKRTTPQIITGQSGTQPCDVIKSAQSSVGVVVLCLNQDTLMILIKWGLNLMGETCFNITFLGFSNNKTNFNPGLIKKKVFQGNPKCLWGKPTIRKKHYDI